MIVPDLPGLGVDLDEKEFAQYPYQPRRLRHFSGTLTDIRPQDAIGYFAVKGTRS